MSSYRLTTYNSAAGENPNYQMGSAQSLNGSQGFIGSTCEGIKASITGGDFNFNARHIVTGDILKRKDVSYTNQFRYFVGYDYIWTGTKPNETEYDPSTSGESHPSMGSCFQFRTDKNAKGQYGLMLGDWTGHNDLERRWSCPIGIQFEWANKHSNSSAVGLAMTGLYFYYMSKRLQSSQYTSLVTRNSDDGKFVHPDSGTAGKNLLLNVKSEVGLNDKTGKVIAFAEPDAITKLKNAKELFYLHAIEMRFYYNGEDNTNKKKFLHFYNFKLLYDVNVTNNSRVVVPQVHHRDNFFRNGGYPI